MRRPRERLGQRVLVYELRHAVDRVVRRPYDGRAIAHLDAVLDDNPHSVTSTHVLYNIGRARREWLAAYIAARSRARVAESPRPASLEVL